MDVQCSVAVVSIPPPPPNTTNCDNLIPINHGKVCSLQNSKASFTTAVLILPDGAWSLRGSLVPPRVPGPSEGPWSLRGSLVPPRFPGPSEGPWSLRGSLVPSRVPGPFDGPWSLRRSLVPSRVPGPFEGPWSLRGVLVPSRGPGPFEGPWSLRGSLVPSRGPGPFEGPWSLRGALVPSRGPVKSVQMYCHDIGMSYWHQHNTCQYSCGHNAAGLGNSDEHTSFFLDKLIIMHNTFNSYVIVQSFFFAVLFLCQHVFINISTVMIQ